MQVWQCSGNSNQTWTVNADGTISNDYTSLCLDVEGNESGDLTPAIQWECNSADPAQQLRLVRTSFGDEPQGFEIVNDNGMCLDDEYASPSNGTPVEWYQCNQTAAQDWRLENPG